MARVAFECYNIFDKHPLKIECLAAWGNKLIVGSSEGHLLIYEIETKEQNGKKIFSAVLKVSQKEFARKRISQITVVEENNMIISLSECSYRRNDSSSFSTEFATRYTSCQI